MKLTWILFFEGKHIWYGAENRPDDKVKGKRVKGNIRARFNFEVFKGIKDLGGQLEYLRNTAMYIDAGSSRIVFAISPTRVIKLAGGMDDSREGEMLEWSRVGREQNKAEYELYNDAPGKVKNLLPIVYRGDSNFDWIMSELVRPLRSDNELMELLGLDEQRYEMFIGTMENDWVDYDDFYRVLNLKQKKIVSNIFYIIDRYNLDTRDLLNYSQWGKAADGRLVLLDAGGTEEIIRDYY